MDVDFPITSLYAIVLSRIFNILDLLKCTNFSLSREIHPPIFFPLQNKAPPHLEGYLLKQRQSSVLKKGWKKFFFIVRFPNFSLSIPLTNVNTAKPLNKGHLSIRDTWFCPILIH